MRHIVILAALVLSGCLGSPRPWAADRAPDARPLFTFAVLTDPHVGDCDGEANLRACVDWLNARDASERVELVFVLGDFGRRLDLAEEALSALDATWVPVIGDGTLEYGMEAEFQQRFGPRMDALAASRSGFSFAFVHHGVRFLVLDWVTREKGGLSRNQADLHAGPGGTLVFLRDTLRAWDDAPADSVLLMSHHPMHAFLLGVGAFSTGEMHALEAVTAPHADRIHANFSGHYHVNWQEDLPRSGYTVIGTEALETGPATIRLVRVHQTGCGFAYEHSLVDAQRWSRSSVRPSASRVVSRKSSWTSGPSDRAAERQRSR